MLWSFLAVGSGRLLIGLPPRALRSSSRPYNDYSERYRDAVLGFSDGRTF